VLLLINYQVHARGETSINADAAFSGSIGLGLSASSTPKSSRTGAPIGSAQEEGEDVEVDEDTVEAELTIAAA
jgi:hypothetical protein